jgi:hypothetical protein
MASNINTTSINESYPVAGVDNDSQGFRDNFATIKSNFVEAKSNIEDLQDNTAKTNANNNFFGNQVTGANLIANTEVLYPGGTVNAGQNVSFANGQVQTFSIGADLTLTLSDWPTASKVGKIRVMLLNDGSSRTVTWAVEAGGAIVVDTAWPTNNNTTVIGSQTNYTIIDFMTIDGGTTVFAEYKGQFAAPA